MENIDKKNQSISTGNSVQISNDTSKDGTPSSVGNLCVACATNKRAVVFVPCGHYIACVPCGHGMAICPICHSKVTACVRIYE